MGIIYWYERACCYFLGNYMRMFMCIGVFLNFILVTPADCVEIIRHVTHIIKSVFFV